MKADEKKFQTVIESIEDGYYEVDLAGNFIFFNQAMCDILGYAKEELAGMNNRNYMDKVITGAHRAAEQVQQVYFPIAGTDKKQAADIPAAKKDNNASRDGRETIMLVDDEKAIRQIFKEFLESHGYQVLLFEDGTEAFSAFEADPDRFDLVITDMTMPKLTGDKLAQQMLKIKPDVPIILWCGFSEDISEDTAVKMGIKKYIQKPIGPRDLLVCIRQILDGK